MTHTTPDMIAHTLSAIGTSIDAMLQQRIPAFTITYLEKKRISDPAALVSQFLHGTADPHFHAISQYQISTTVYANKTVLAIEIDYLENSTQLSYVNQKVQQIIHSITDESMHQQQKLLAIHDWITTHIRYDQTRQRRTAFDALDTHSTVCSGYASLYWHMCRAVGIPCRIVTGTGKFEAHAWNMVQLDQFWYHVDSTWCTVADTNTPFSTYRFYLLTDKEIQHTHAVTVLAGQKPFPPAQMQYREQLHQLGRTMPRLHGMVRAILQKTGLIYLEPEHTVVGIVELNTRMYQALYKQQTRVIFGYRGATVSAPNDVREVLNELKTQHRLTCAITITLYPMPHGFVDDGVLVDMQMSYASSGI
jgi:hypothetical protein